MPNDAARIRIDAFPAANRAAVWMDALAGLSLSAEFAAAGFVDGEITIRHSGTAARLGFLRSGPQRLLSVARKAAASSALALVLSGRGRMQGTASGSEISQGDLVVFDMAEPWSIDWQGEFELLFLLLPAGRLSSRFGRASVNLPVVLGSSRAATAARPVMRMLGPDVTAPDQADLTSLENALVELAASAVVAETRTGAAAATAAQAAQLRRLTAAIEARLGDPTLSVTDIARQEGTSVRSIQRLFESGGDSFSGYLRHRRLARCEGDLADPHYAEEAIADIARRWGFRDQAHFSRAFAARNGLSPSAYRRQAKPDPEWRLTRGRPPGHAPPEALRPKAWKESAACLTAPARATRRAAIPEWAEAAPQRMHVLPARPETVHWGFSAARSRRCSGSGLVMW